MRRKVDAIHQRRPFLSQIKMYLFIAQPITVGVAFSWDDTTVILIACNTHIEHCSPGISLAPRLQIFHAEHTYRRRASLAVKDIQVGWSPHLKSHCPTVAAPSMLHLLELHFAYYHGNCVLQIYTCTLTRVRKVSAWLPAPPTESSCRTCAMFSYPHMGVC